ncbi:MAG: cadherin-like beta sandwich domain-containing protein [Bacilli bacterium]|nr:cadherin-like beta sandwich domain-containing protein [Bacilli bacterium]
MNKIFDIIKKNYKIIAYLLLLIVGVFVVLLNRGTYSVDEDTNVDGLRITCTESANKGEDFECSISLNSVSMITKGLIVNYSVDEGIEFVEFTSDNWEVSTKNESGFVLVNLDGVSGEVSVGSVKFKMPTDAVANSTYKIELVDATIGDGENTVFELETVYANVRVKSDINTLDNITISNGSLNEEFNKDTFEYTSSVDSDMIVIEVTKTDDKSTVLGTGEVSLHYGTNSINIIVTAEDGSEKTYSLSIFRTYEFSSDIYTYSKENNYIYTGIDTDSNTILNNIDVSNELNKEIIDNKLIISYRGESILEIDILSIDFNNYIFNNNILYVDSVLSFDSFVNNINYSDGISFKVFNGNDEITGDTLLSNEMILKVYYDANELDNYSIGIYNLVFENTLTIDNDNKYIKHLTIGTSVSQFIDLVTVVGGNVFIYDKDGNEKNNIDIIATGDILRSYLGDKLMDEYKLSVIGDSNGDGKLSLLDLAQFRKHYVKWVNPNTGVKFEVTGAYEQAFDFNKDGRISIVDLAIMRKKEAGVIE